MNLLLYSTLYFLIVLVKATPPSPPQRPLKANVVTDSIFDANFDTFVKDTLEAWHVPGLSIAVVDGDSVYSKVLISLWSSEARMLTKLPGLWVLPSTRCGSNS